MKKIISILSVILLVMLLLACGETQTGTSVWQEAPTVPQEDTSLTVFCMSGLKGTA